MEWRDEAAKEARSKELELAVRVEAVGGGGALMTLAPQILALEGTPSCSLTGCQIR